MCLSLAKERETAVGLADIGPKTPSPGSAAAAGPAWPRGDREAQEETGHTASTLTHVL